MDLLEEDSCSLDGFLTEWALAHGELEGIGDFIAEVADGEGIAAGGFGEDARLLFVVVKEAASFVSECFWYLDMGRGEGEWVHTISRMC